MLSQKLAACPELILDFEELELNLKGIRILNRVPTSVHFISQLYLDGNHLLSLSGIEQFVNLQVLHFDYNYISLVNELNKISNPFFMRELSFIANPIENDPKAKLQQLKQKRFTRLSVLNPPHRLTQNLHKFSSKKDQRQYSRVNPEQTERRRPKYSNRDLSTSRSTLVGKIYSRPMTSHQKWLKQQVNNSKQTKQSTGRPWVTDSPINVALVKQKESVASFNEGEGNQIKIQSGYATARFDQSAQKQQMKLSQILLNEEKQRLAALYSKRRMIEKYFVHWQKYHCEVGRRADDSMVPYAEQNLSEFSGELLNNHLETIHFSLIKLKIQNLKKK